MGTVTLEEAMMKIQKVANMYYDGHYTLMKFTTGYKVFFGTPDFSDEGRKKIEEMPAFENVTTAIVNAVILRYEA